MKKILMLTLVAMFATINLYAESGSDYNSDYNSNPNRDTWKIEPLLGPTIDIDSWGGSQFSIDTKIGKGENWSGLVGLNFGGANAVQLKLGAVFDYPFYLTFSKTNDFAIGPTFDAGMRFGAGGGRGTYIDFLNLGFGLRTAYKINNNFGVVANLVHFTTSFVGWTNGAGVTSHFAMAYDMRFGIYYLI